MRTVFIGAHETPNGINSYTFNLALALKRRGFESKVLAFGTCSKVLDYNGVTIKQYKTYGSTITSLPALYIKSLPYLIKHRKEIDLVSYQTVTFSVIPSLVCRLFGMKTCAIIHSLPEDSPKHSPLKKQMMVAAMKLALALTSNVITVSNTKAQEVYERYKKKCIILPCGVFLPKNEVLNTNIFKKNGIKPGSFFLTIGRVDPIKNLETLIDAFKQHDHGEYQLVIGGDVDNAYGKTILERAKGCKNIIFPGVVYGEAKAALLQNCLAYCLVSSSEGLPIALLEGMSYGKIPVVTRIPSIQEVLEKYNIGLWSVVKNVGQLACNMKTIEDEYEKYSGQGKIAQEIVEQNYTWPHICDKFLNMVKKF